MSDDQPTPAQVAQQLRRLQALIERTTALYQQREQIVLQNEPALNPYREKLKPGFYLLGLLTGLSFCFPVLAVVAANEWLLIPIALVVAIVGGVIGIWTGVFLLKKRANPAVAVVWFLWAATALFMIAEWAVQAWNTLYMTLLVVILSTGVLGMLFYNAMVPVLNAQIGENNEARKAAANAHVAPQLDQIDAERRATYNELKRYARLVPDDYRDQKRVGKLAKYIEDGRADNVRDALVLLDQHEHYRKVEKQAGRR